MIRFIDVRGQGTGSKFSFYCTIGCEYIYQDTCCVWDSWEEFAIDAASDGSEETNLCNYKSICPQWVFTQKPHSNTSTESD